MINFTESLSHKSNNSARGCCGQNILFILKRRPRFHISRTIQLLMYFVLIKSWAILFWLGFPYWHQNIGVFGAPDPQEINCHHSDPKRYFAGSNGVVWAIVRWNLYELFGCGPAEEIKNIYIYIYIKLYTYTVMCRAAERRLLIQKLHTSFCPWSVNCKVVSQ